VRRAAGILAIAGAALVFLATILPYAELSGGRFTYHVLTAIGHQPFRLVAGMAIYHWTSVLILVAAGAWLLDPRRPPVFAAGVLFGLGSWLVAQAVSSLLVSQHRLIGGWFDVIGKLTVAAAGILAALVVRRSTAPTLPPPPPPGMGGVEAP
jgi:hypothetical protein